jgi:hypothetical protein
MTDWDNVSTWVGAHVVALAVVAAPVLMAEATGSTSTIDDWVRIYVAGAFGGLVLELITSRGQIEIPGPAKPTSSEDEAADPRRALLPQFDLGVFARLFLGGMAAVVALMLVAAASDKETAQALKDAAASDASIGWAIATGAASAAVWTTLQRLATARIEALLSVQGATRDGTTALREELDTLRATRNLAEDTGQGAAIERMSGGLAVLERQLNAAATRRGRR